MNYISNGERHKLYSTKGQGFSLNGHDIIGFNGTQVAIQSGALRAAYDPKPTANAHIAANIAILNLPDHSVSSTFSLWDTSGLGLDYPSYTEIIQYRDGLWDGNGPLMLTHGQMNTDDGWPYLYNQQLVRTVTNLTTGQTTTDKSITDERLANLSQSSIHRLGDGSVLVTVNSSQYWKGQIYDADGMPVGTPYIIDNYNPSSFNTVGVRDPITIYEDDTLLTWLYRKDGLDKIYGVALDETGTTKSDTTILAEASDGRNFIDNYDTIVLKNGGVAVIWNEQSDRDDNRFVDRVEVHVRILDTQGAQVGKVQTLYLEEEPPAGVISIASQMSVAELSNGGFVVAFQSTNAQYAIFNAKGEMLGEVQDLQLSERTGLFYDALLDLAGTPDGNLLLLGMESKIKNDGSIPSRVVTELMDINVDFKSTAQDDWRLGTSKANKIKGKGGDDRIEGHKGADQLIGGLGADTLLGGDGQDRLQGQRGKDILEGGKHDDILSGGRGADLFVFRVGIREGTDQITDFNPNKDRIEISGAEFADLRFTGNLTRAEIHHQNDTIILQDISLAQVTEDFFVFT